MNVHRVRGVLGIRIDKVPGVITRAEAMLSGMGSDPATYAAPVPPLPAFKILIDNTTETQVAARKRTVGAAATSTVACGLLIEGMKSELFYLHTLANLAPTPAHAVALFQNAGVLVAGYTAPTKELLALTLGVQPGTVHCEANVGLLVGVGAPKPHQNRFFNWSYTLDGSKTFVNALSTSVARTTLVNLPSLTLVGVRVSLTNAAGPGPWSQVVTILVH